MLLQSVNVGLSEDAAFARDGMQLDANVALVAELLRRNLQLRVDLVDDRARSSGALVVHRRDFFLAAGVLVLFEDNNLGILPAQLYDRVHFGMHLFYRQRDCSDFLHELGAHQIGQRSTA